ncbi:MAG: hypothetical protein NTW03_22445 [Verrucomicrobia bacterium]|nr:hypothetical protein [Verrucomicrobiota bacterium]
MRFFPCLSRWFLLTLLAAAVGLCFAGCKSTEPENEALRPWNAPKGWETGLPSGMMEQRR